MTNNPNDRQVGGNHYQAAYQHWDMAMECCLGYFEGQISKYVFRHKKKNGLQDLQKAAHFTERLLQELERFPDMPRRGAPIPVVMRCLGRLFLDSNTPQGESAIITLAACWSRVEELEQVLKLLDDLAQHHYGEPARPARPA